jgi:guanylate kinase
MATLNASGGTTGKLFIMVGPAGTGKNSLMKAAIAAVPNLRQLPTATSRPMRSGEQEGREHFFVTRQQFETIMADDDLLEWQMVHGTHYYGMVRSRTREVLENGELVIADIDYLGARAAKLAYPDSVVTIFITPPSSADLLTRLRSRGENLAETSKRLLRAPREMAVAPECDYVILNDVEAEAAAQLIDIIHAEAAGSHHDIPRTHVPQMNIVARAVFVPDDARVPEQVHHVQASVMPDELPHLAAIRAARTACGDTLPDGEWQFAPAEEDGFIPPTDVFMQTNPGSTDEAVYVYTYRLAPGSVFAPSPAVLTAEQMTSAS